MPERACTSCGTPTHPGPRCPDCTHLRDTNRWAWSRLRQRIIQRDGGCIICGTQDDLDVHHIEQGSDDPSNLETRCHQHHVEAHHGHHRPA